MVWLGFVMSFSRHATVNALRYLCRQSSAHAPKQHLDTWQFFQETRNQNSGKNCQDCQLIYSK